MGNELGLVIQEIEREIVILNKMLRSAELAYKVANAGNEIGGHFGNEIERWGHRVGVVNTVIEGATRNIELLEAAARTEDENQIKEALLLTAVLANVRKQAIAGLA